MNALDTELDQQADRLAEAALNELGDTLLDEPDEYLEQCHFAGCYPWLGALAIIHPHESLLSVNVSDSDV